jgi:Lamin Tail Domain
MSDGLFFTLIIVFFFLLWVASGGPTRPISFAGAFITPITDENQTQTGYGPQVSLNTKISAAGASVSTTERSTTGITDTSPYAGDVVLTHFVNGTSSTDPEQEYIGLEVSDAAKQAVTISGWSLRSTVTGTNAIIPNGVQDLTLGQVSLLPITLKPGNEAYLTTGISPVNVSFEQNTCINDISDASKYTSCVQTNSSQSTFLTGLWRIYFAKKARLWKNTGDTIELLDANGAVVDSFST